LGPYENDLCFAPRFGFSPEARTERAAANLTLHKALQALATAWMSELAQRLGFNLANPFARNRELLTHFFECMIGFLPDTETHPQDLLFAWREGRQDLSGLLLKVNIYHGIRRGNDPFVFDKIAKMAVFLFPYRSFQRDRLLCYFEDLSHLV